tara:strand:- start:4723 stop:4902 length:180 start_codon:yes stop_codon:yes gene_type:complete
MTQQEIRELRMEVLRLAVENGTPADVNDPIQLANKYWNFVCQEERFKLEPPKPPPSRKR